MHCWMENIVFAVVVVHVAHTLLFCLLRIVTGNNTNNKSESDQEDNDDVNDNDWSYGAEKKGDLLLLCLSLLWDPVHYFWINGLSAT